MNDQDPKTKSRSSPKIMQIHCKPGGLEDKDPKTESGFSPKLMQKHPKPGSLEDQDPKSEIFIDFQNRIWSQNTGADKIIEIQTGYAKCSPFGKINVDLAPKSCKFTDCKPAGLEDQDLQTEPGFGTKIMQIHANTLLTK